MLAVSSELSKRIKSENVLNPYEGEKLPDLFAVLNEFSSISSRLTDETVKHGAVLLNSGRNFRNLASAYEMKNTLLISLWCHDRFVRAAFKKAAKQVSEKDRTRDLALIKSQKEDFEKSVDKSFRHVCSTIDQYEKAHPSFGTSIFVRLATMTGLAWSGYNLSNVMPPYELSHMVKVGIVSTAIPFGCFDLIQEGYARAKDFFCKKTSHSKPTYHLLVLERIAELENSVSRPESAGQSTATANTLAKQ